MPEIQQFIIAPDKRAQGTAADLAAFVAAVKAHPMVTLLKQEEAYAKVLGPNAALDELMQSYGDNLMMAVDAMLQMPEPPGPLMGKTVLQAPQEKTESVPDKADDEDNIL